MSLAIKSYLGISDLFDVSVIKSPDSVEHSLKYCHVLLVREWHDKSEGEIFKMASEAHSAGPEAYSNLAKGLLYSLLTTLNDNPRIFSLAQSAITDNWSSFIEQLKYFSFTRYFDLKEHVRRNLFWLVDRLISIGAKGCDGLLLGLLRQYKAGNHEEENVMTLESLVTLLEKNHSWMLAQSAIIPYVLYPLLRIITEEGLPGDLLLRICHICNDLLANKYKECSLLGRDLVRAMLEISSLPLFNGIWQWLLVSKGANEPAPIVRLLLTPSPKKYLVMRLTPSTEADLKFILEHAPHSQLGYYFNLFMDAHLQPNFVPKNDLDLGSALVDLVRFIAVGIHPTNSVLASPVIQRWLLITWLLKSIKTGYTAASAKLALLFDWLFFDPAIDNIMCLEAGLLTMMRNITTTPNITNTLIEFLALAQSKFFPPLSDFMQKSLIAAMTFCIERGVIPSLDVFLNSPMLPLDVKQMLKNTFSGSKPDLDTSLACTETSSPLVSLSDDKSALEDTNPDDDDSTIASAGVHVLLLFGQPDYNVSFIASSIDSLFHELSLALKPTVLTKTVIEFVENRLFDHVQQCKNNPDVRAWVDQLFITSWRYEGKFDFGSVQSLFSTLRQGRMDDIFCSLLEMASFMNDDELGLVSELSSMFSVELASVIDRLVAVGRLNLDSHENRSVWKVLILAHHIGLPSATIFDIWTKFVVLNSSRMATLLKDMDSKLALVLLEAFRTMSFVDDNEACLNTLNFCSTLSLYLDLSSIEQLWEFVCSLNSKNGNTSSAPLALCQNIQLITFHRFHALLKSPIKKNGLELILDSLLLIDKEESK